MQVKEYHGKMQIPHIAIGHIPGCLRNGIRVITCLRRNKDSGGTNEYKRHLIDKVSRNEEEWEEIVDQMLNEMPRDTRLYCSVNARNATKVSALICKKHLEVLSSNDKTNLEHLVSHPLQTGISALMTQETANERYFLWDCDDLKEIELAKELIGEALIADIPTKQGAHLISTPFNPEKMSCLKNTTLKRDALYLIAYMS